MWQTTIHSKGTQQSGHLSSHINWRTSPPTRSTGPCSVVDMVTSHSSFVQRQHFCQLIMIWIRCKKISTYCYSAHTYISTNFLAAAYDRHMHLLTSLYGIALSFLHLHITLLEFSTQIGEFAQSQGCITEPILTLHKSIVLSQDCVCNEDHFCTLGMCWCVEGWQSFVMWWQSFVMCKSNVRAPESAVTIWPQLRGLLQRT